MAENGSTSTQSFSTKGIPFTIRAPFAEGYELNQQEAGQLNQVFSENVRNNTAKIVAEAVDAAKKEDRGLSEEEISALQAKIAAYADEYTFAGKRVSRSSADPVLKEATKLARAALKSLLNKKGVEVSDERFDELVQDLLNTRPQFKEEAARRVEAQKGVAADSLGDLSV